MAAMKPKLSVSAPSPALLRFLRSQSEGACFFTPNPRHGTFVFDHAAPRACQPRFKPDAKQSNPSIKSFSTTTKRRTTLEAGYHNFAFLWPRVIEPSSQAVRAQSRSGNYPSRVHHMHYTRRNASRGWLWSKLRGGAESSQKQRPLMPDDLPGSRGGEEGAESMFTLGRTMSVKAANEPKLRCTEFDENGNVVLVNGEFKKSELIAKYGLLPRDLRKIDSSLLPHILVRPSAILINLLHLRCLIKANRVLVFDAYGSTDSYTQSLFMYDLEGKLRQKQYSPSAGGLPYEFRALEAVLISVTSGLESEFETVREPVVRVLRALEEDIDRDKLRHLLVYSKKLGTFEQKAKLVRDAIDELLEADDDLADMYLSEKTHDIIRGEDDHTEVELLLESYHKICDEIVQASANLVSNIRNTEEVVKAILDANRNSLMLLDLKFSIGTLSLSSAALIAAFYGMNLKNFIEEADVGFGAVSLFSFGLAFTVSAWGIRKLKRVQRVSMWGESGVGVPKGYGSRGSWRQVDDGANGTLGRPGSPAEKHLLEAARKERSKRLKEEKLNTMKNPKPDDASKIPLVPSMQLKK